MVDSTNYKQAKRKWLHLSFCLLYFTIFSSVRCCSYKQSYADYVNWDSCQIIT